MATVVTSQDLSTDFEIDSNQTVRVNVGNLPVVLTSTVGAANGVAPLDGSGHVPTQYVNFSGATFQGTWDALTNTPTLADGIGTNGDFYLVSSTSFQDLGSGNIPFEKGDMVIYNEDLLIWQRSGSSIGVSSLNGASGVVTITTDEVPEGSVNHYFSNTLARSAISVSGNYLTYASGVVTSTVPTLATVASSGSYADLSNTPNLNAFALKPVVVTISGSNSILPTSTFYTAVCLTASSTQTLPSPSQYSQYVVNIKSAVVDAAVSISGNIDGGVQVLSLSPYDSRQFHSDGTTWWIV